MRPKQSRESGLNDMTFSIRITPLALSLTLFTLSPSVLAAGTELILNGDFEAGNLSGWTLNNQLLSTGTFQRGDSTQTNGFGPISPVENYNNAGAKTGDYYATTDSLAPGTDAGSSMVMYQNISLASFTSFTTADLTFDLVAQDYTGLGPLNDASTTALDHTQATPTQFVRVDLIKAGALDTDAFTIAPSDVLQIFYLGGSSTSSPTYDPTYTFSLTSLLNAQKGLGNESLSLRFSVLSTGGGYHANIDNVSLLATGAAATAAPEGSSLAYLLCGVAPLLLLRRRRTTSPS